MGLGDEGRPPRPVMALQVGVSGHRALPGADLGALQGAAAGLFRALKAEALRLHAADQAAAAPLYRPGPPQLRCLCGLAEGADSLLAEAALAEGWSVVACLPFPRADFAHDFEGAALEHFQALLARAASVCELDGSRARGGEPYAAVGEQIVEQSDVLLVIWDGLPPRGPGGTGDVVRGARGRGVPVAVLPSTGAAVIEWDGDGDAGRLLHPVLMPPEADRKDVDAFLAAVPRLGGWAAGFVRGFERAVLVGARRTERPVVPGPAPGVDEARLLAFFTPADELASEEAARYRAAGLLRYGLILPATLGAFLGTFGAAWVRPFGQVLQFAALAAVVLYASRGGWERAQHRFLAYRALAEYLRNARMLIPLGAVARPPDVAAYQIRAADWTGWYGRAALREVGLPAGGFDAAAVARAAAVIRAEASGQMAFLLGRAERFGWIAGRLRRLGVALFASGLVFEALRVVLSLLDARALPLLGELSLWLPAMAPVFLGVLSFGEYSRLEARYRAVAAALQAALAALDKAGPSRGAVLLVGRQVAGVMLAEGADWQILIRARTVSAF